MAGRKDGDSGAEIQLSRQEEDALADFIDLRLQEARQRGEERAQLTRSMQLAGIDPDLFYLYGYDLADPAIHEIHNAVRGDNIEEVSRKARERVLDVYFSKGFNSDLYFELARQMLEEAWGKEAFIPSHIADATSTVYNAALKPLEVAAGFDGREGEQYVQQIYFGKEPSAEEKPQTEKVRKAIELADKKKQAFQTLVQIALQLSKAPTGAALSSKGEEKKQRATTLTGITLEDMMVHVKLQNATGGIATALKRFPEQEQHTYHTVGNKLEAYSAPEKIVQFLAVTEQLLEEVRNEKVPAKEVLLRKLEPAYSGDEQIKESKMKRSLGARKIVDKIKPASTKLGLGEVVDREKESTASIYARIIEVVPKGELQREFLHKAIETGIIYAGVGADGQAKALLELGERYVTNLVGTMRAKEQPSFEEETMVAQLLIALANGYSLLGDVSKTEELVDRLGKEIGRDIPGYCYERGEMREAPLHEIAPGIERRAYLQAVRRGKASQVDASDREDLVKYFKDEEKQIELAEVMDKIAAFKDTYATEVPELQKLGWREVVREIATPKYAEALALLTGRDGLPRENLRLYAILELETKVKEEAKPERKSLWGWLWGN